MSLPRLSLAAFNMLLSANGVAAEKSFDGVTCKSDIPSALIGRQMPNERVVLTEPRHKDIGLKHLGAYGMENEGDPWTLITWEICGRDYIVLERRGVVKDVLAAPLPKESLRSQIVSCVADGASKDGTAVAFVSVDKQPLRERVQNVWLIDEKKIKFSKIEGEEIMCATPK